MFRWFRKKDRNNQEAQTVENDLTQDQFQENGADANPEAKPLEDLKEPAESEQMEPLQGQQQDENDISVDESIQLEVVDTTDEAIDKLDLKEPDEERSPQEEASEGADIIPEDALNTPSKKSLFGRFRDRLSATRERIAGRMESLLSHMREIDDELLDELEEILITADLGVTTTNDLLFKIRGQVAKKELNDPEALKDALKKRIMEMLSLKAPEMPDVSPLVIMVVGVNGVGKTTTIAKLAKRYIDQGKKVLLAAGDTFRSAAVDQLGIWAKRLGADIVAQPTGADAAAVVYDALAAAKARNIDVVLIDTAGRLHTKVNLMDELKKIRRVADKSYPGAPHHSILVVDGNTGQNALNQARNFNEAVPLDSVIITKLDGTAKGGVIVSICNELKIPVTFVGLGESFEDLQPFDAEAFTKAILGL